MLLSDCFEKEIKSSYRGVFRKNLLNELSFEDYCKYDKYFNDEDYILDFNQAKELLYECRNIGLNLELLECIEVVDQKEDFDEINTFEKEFLGYDVCDHINQSLIFWFGYDVYTNKNQFYTIPTSLLNSLTLDYFSQHLNENKLFDNFNLAKLLGDTELALYNLDDSLNHLHINSYKILKLYKINI